MKQWFNQNDSVEITHRSIQVMLQRLVSLAYIELTALK